MGNHTIETPGPGSYRPHSDFGFYPTDEDTLSQSASMKSLNRPGSNQLNYDMKGKTIDLTQKPVPLAIINL